MAFTLAKIEESQAEEMIIPDSVKEILSNTFLKLPNLKKVTFGKNVNVIENKFGFVKRNIKARIFCVLFCVFIWKETLGCVWIRRSL